MEDGGKWLVILAVLGLFAGLVCEGRQMTYDKCAKLCGTLGVQNIGANIGACYCKESKP